MIIVLVNAIDRLEMQHIRGYMKILPFNHKLFRKAHTTIQMD